MRIEIARVRPRWAVGLLQLLLPLAVWAQLVHAAPVLYEGGGGWGAVRGLPAEIEPLDSSWVFTNGIWMGRIPANATNLEWGEHSLSLDEAHMLPLGAARLPTTGNPFGLCVVRSLSVLYDNLLRSRRWSVVFDQEGQPSGFFPLDLAGRAVEFSLRIEDAATGQSWDVQPMRRAREGGLFSAEAGNARLYSGSLDDAGLDWSLIVTPLDNDRVQMHGRIMLQESASRCLRVRVFLQTGAVGVPAIQDELPPAIVSVHDGLAVALLMDLKEPRRFRAVTEPPNQIGMEYDLAVTRETGNFPRWATFSLEAVAWPARDADEAMQGVGERLLRASPILPLPYNWVELVAAGLPAFEPAYLRSSHPGGFRSSYDYLQYLMLLTSGLLPTQDWVTSAFSCAAQNAAGEWMLTTDGDAASLVVNPDPDMEVMLGLGQNRGRTLLQAALASSSPMVWIRAMGTPEQLDYNPRALHLCDYPAVWAEGDSRSAVDVRHAEVEAISAVACVLKEKGVCVLVSDAGPMAPFTTFYADALVCESAKPEEMRRQHALAGSRPVLWRVYDASQESEALACELGFVTFGKIAQD